MQYSIQKPSSWKQGKWELAWGFKKKSVVNVMSENEAIEIFNQRVAKCRTPYRLIHYTGVGYNPTVEIIAVSGAIPDPIDDPAYQQKARQWEKSID